MQTVEEYRKRAQEAVELAQKARTSERAALLDVAKVWLRLADEREAALRATSPETSKLKTTNGNNASMLLTMPMLREKVDELNRRQPQRVTSDD